MIRRVLLTLGLLVAIGGCELGGLGGIVKFAGQSALGGAAGTVGAYVVSTLASLAPTLRADNIEVLNP